jgi:hypothetical protein
MSTFCLWTAFHIALTKRSDDWRFNDVEHIRDDFLSSLGGQVKLGEVYGKDDE